MSEIGEINQPTCLDFDWEILAHLSQKQEEPKYIYKADKNLDMDLLVNKIKRQDLMVIHEYFV